MTAPYECEVRISPADIGAVHQRIAVLGGTARLRYAFTDHYYRPASPNWDPRERALRIREHHEPPASAEILLTRVRVVQTSGFSFKRSSFPEGKVRLYTGTVDACREIVGTLSFESWLTVRKRDGTLFEIPGHGELVTEYVEGLGWMVEFEHAGADAAAAAAAIRRMLTVLELDEREVVPEPVAALVAARRPEDHRGR